MNLFSRGCWRPRKLMSVVFGALVIFSCVYIMINKSRPVAGYDLIINEQAGENRHPVEEEKCSLVNANYRQVLQDVASEQQIIILTQIDDGYLDMTLNFVEVSVIPNKIANILFLAPFQKTCDKVQFKGLNCFIYNDDSVTADDAKVGSKFNSVAFHKKTLLRTKAILDALTCGFTVFVTDVDVIFFHNPLPYYNCSDCSLEIQDDGGLHNLNSGSVFLRPTKSTLLLYRSMVKKMETSTRMSNDQIFFNQILKSLGDKIKYRVMDKSRFVCGLYYYEFGNRHFAENMAPCPECVQVHNNFMETKQAKVYRFRETGNWMYNEDDYYNKMGEMFLTYGNPIKMFFQEESMFQLEYASLINALAIGYILGRTVILPKFHCTQYANECSLISHFRLADFEKIFGSRFKERSFLLHPKVPDEVKDSMSTSAFIESEVLGKYCPSVKPLNGDKICKTLHPDRGASSGEILECFKSSKERVLRFHSLYNTFSHFLDKKTEYEFRSNVSQAFKRYMYRQHLPYEPDPISIPKWTVRKFREIVKSVSNNSTVDYCL